MLSKISVKKPMTVLVCVVLVLVLGIVSFTRMTPDLLPNMDFPYAIILTTYGGQTPETVEMAVSKPLESSMSTIDGVKKVTSTSSENFSLVMIEFNDGTNMDTATVDMRSSLDTIQDMWPEAVGTPYLIKVNPNMMPVSLAAVDYDGKSQTEMSDYVEDVLMNKLEGIDGVASVSTKGLVTETENVVLSQKKLDELNKKISDALDDQFGEGEEKLDKAKKEIEDNIQKAESGASTIQDSIDQINAQQENVSAQLKDAKTQADNGKTKLLNARMELLSQKASLAQTKQTMEMLYQALLEIKSSLSDFTIQKSELMSSQKLLEDYQTEVTSLSLALDDADDSQRADIKKRLEEIAKELKERFNTSSEKISEAIAKVKSAIETIDKGIADLREKLKEQGTPEEKLDEVLSQLVEQIKVIDSGIAQMNIALDGLDSNAITVNEALAEIEAQRSNADFKMASGLATLLTKQTEVNSALAQLKTAKQEIEKSADEVAEQKKQAKSKADMSKTVSLDTITGILTAQDFSMPAGYVIDNSNNKLMVRVGDGVEKEDELKNLVLFDTGIDGIGVVKLSEVADVFTVDDSSEVYAKINGKPGVILSFSKQSDAATSEVCENINNEFNSLSEKTPELKFTTLFNQGDYIDIVVNSVLQNLLMGAALAIIILFLFLRDIKPTIIVACSIPISVIFAIVLMYFSGVSLNMISLSGLAIGVGMLVDNSVVVIENIYRLRSLGYSPIKSALSGASQVAGAIAASTLTTICVFFPILFVEGITRQIFVDMALTIAYSLIASLIVALTLVPAMSQRMLRKTKEQKEAKQSKIMNVYERSLRFALKHRLVTLLIVIAVLFASVFGAFAKGFSFMPNMSSTELQVTLKLDDNATFEETVDAAEQLNNILNAHDEFETIGVMVGGTQSLMGLSAGGKSSDAGSAMAYAVLKDDYRKQSEELTKKLEDECSVIKADVTVGGGSSGSTSTLLGGSGVTVNLYGDDLEVMQKTAKDMAEQLEKVSGIDTVDSGVGATSPEIKITVDKKKAIEKSLTVAQVFQQIASAIVTEKTSTTLTNENGDDINIVVVKDDSKQLTADQIRDIKLTYTTLTGEEKSVELADIADISKSETMNSIKRQNQSRYISVSGTVKDGFTVTAVTNDTKKLFDSYKLPEGCSIEYAGSDATTMEAMSQLGLMLLLAVVLIYLIMVAQFQSLKSPFIIMFTIPLAFTGGFLGLLLTGFDVSVVSMIGFVMLSGIIVNNGIVLVDYINKLRIAGAERREAIVEAGRTRMRPILITALTTILGLSVMALGIGTGAEMMQPIAVVCIGGLVYATFMTLYVVPVIYDLLNKKELRKVEDADLELVSE